MIYISTSLGHSLNKKIIKLFRALRWLALEFGRAVLGLLLETLILCVFLVYLQVFGEVVGSHEAVGGEESAREFAGRERGA